MPYLSPPLPGRRLARTVTRLAVTAFVSAALLAPVRVNAQLQREAPRALSNAEFWEIFTTMSEPGGTFASENFVSNEMTFQDVIPTLQRSLTPGAVYLGVGPEQNFTYIANLKPQMAVIFDIRRQNAMLHLMYKALFEMSPTRAEFVARLFSRPLAFPPGLDAKASDLFDAVASAAPSDSVYLVNYAAIMKSLTETHGFTLSPTDVASIEHVYSVFFDGGSTVNYSYRPGSRGGSYSTYPVYGTLQSTTNADSVQMAFLATEQNYRAVRELHLRNLIVPVVGDFGGPKAIRAVGDYLRQRRMKVGAFYLSNVEQYLFQQAGAADRFYANVGTLPFDSTSTFIRSVPGGGLGGGMVRISRLVTTGSVTISGTGTGAVTVGNGTVITMTTIDSGGIRRIQLTQDSAGIRTTRVLQDSAGQVVMRPLDSTFAGRIVPIPPSSATPTARVANALLASGISSIQKTLDAMAAGQIVRYQDIINMTKTGDWKPVPKKD